MALDRAVRHSQSESVYDEGHVLPDSYQVEVNEGDFDLSGFEVTRAEYIDTQIKTRLTLTASSIKFSMGCINKLPEAGYVELLVHPELKLLAVRPAVKNSKNAIKWRTLKDEEHHPKPIGAKAFAHTMFKLFGWDTNGKYCVRGERIANEAEAILMFKMSDTEVFLRETANDDDEHEKSETIHSFPTHWAKHFGDEYYRRAQIKELLEFEKSKSWSTSSEGITYDKYQLDVTSPSVLKTEIDDLIENFKKDDDDNE